MANGLNLMIAESISGNGIKVQEINKAHIY